MIYALKKQLKNTIGFFFMVFLLINATHSQENRFQEIKGFKEFKNLKVQTITQDKFNNIWLGTNQGLFNYNGIELKSYDFKIGNSSKNISTIFCKNDTILIGKNKNLHVKTYNKLFTYDAKNVRKIFAHNNAIFIGTNQGLVNLKEDYLQPLKTTYKLDFSIVNDIIFYKNKYIIATNSGLWQIENLFNPNQITEIEKGNFSSLLQIENRLFTIKNGSKIVELNADNQLNEIYTKSNIKSIANIQNKLYVISKNEGIDILNASNFIFEKRLNKYNSNLNSNVIKTVFQDAENNIFIATENSLFIKKSEQTTTKPVLDISEIAVNYIPVDTINTSNYSKTLPLEPNQNNISFLLQSVSISHPKNIEFRYKLKDKFSPWSSQTQVNFANLQAGNYNFIAQARLKNADAINSKQFAFKIKTPFYKQVWFYMLSVVVFCLLFAGLVELYLRKVKKKHQEKVANLQLENHLLSLEQKALQLQMNPHFIFNVLNGIKALGNTDNKKELNKTISQFSVLLRSVLNNSRLEEISLQEEVVTLKTYLQLEQQMNSKKFIFDIETSLNGMDSEEILIPPMLVQPFVENAIKHGIQQNNSNNKISINFTIKNRFLECIVTDSGIGFYQSQKNKSNKNHSSVALKVTKERIENLSKYSRFSIEEIKKENKVLGTKVWFKIPLKTDF